MLDCPNPDSRPPSRLPNADARMRPVSADTGHVPAADELEYCHPPASSLQGLCGLLYERHMQTNMLGALAPLPLRDPCALSHCSSGPLSHCLFGTLVPLPTALGCRPSGLAGRPVGPCCAHRA
eukprot:6591506-Prymnesium_polylepis.3